VLAAFTLMASYFFHAFWAVPADQAFVTQLLFYKNIAVAGGLLALVASGAGGWSVDARREPVTARLAAA
jgi:putative oxidoreductase